MSDSTNKRSRDGEGDAGDKLKRVKKDEDVKEANGDVKNVYDLNEEDSDPDDEEYDLGEEDDEDEELGEEDDEELYGEAVLGEDEEEDLGEEDEIDDECESLPSDLNIDVSGYNPTEDDFDGIKCLLKRLWLKENVDLNELTDILIKETVSTVFKQELDEEKEEEVDEEEDDTVLGVLGLISLAHFGEKKCIKEIREVLLSHLPKNNAIAEKLNSESKCALVVHERFLNISSQISIPAYSALVSEIKEKTSSKDEGDKYNFDYVLLVSKVAKDKEETIYNNPEEELFHKEAEASFEYSVSEQCDSDLVTEWADSDKVYKPYRKLMLMTKDKWLSTIDSLAELI